MRLRVGCSRRCEDALIVAYLFGVEVLACVRIGYFVVKLKKGVELFLIKATAAAGGGPF